MNGKGEDEKGLEEGPGNSIHTKTLKTSHNIFSPNYNRFPLRCELMT